MPVLTGFSLLILLSQCFRFSDKYLTGKSQSQCSLHSPKEQQFRQVRNPRVSGQQLQTPASVAAEETTVFLKVLFTDNIFHFLPVRFSDILQLP